MSLVEGKNIIISGATSGIGRFFYEKLSESNTVIPLVRSKNKAEQVLGSASSIVLVDLRRPESIQEIVFPAITKMGGVDILINCAGTYVPNSSNVDQHKVWQDTLNVNLVSPAILIDVCSKNMIENSVMGSILNISSVYDSCFRRNTSIPYSASKASLSHITKHYAYELSSYGIRVNAISPGWFETEMTRPYWEHNQKEWKKMTKKLPIPRSGKLDDLWGAMSLLVSSEASYITGQILGIDGGFSLNVFESK